MTKPFSFLVLMFALLQHGGGGGVGGPTGVATLLANCNLAACHVTLPPGTFTFSQPIEPVASITITGAGAQYQNLTGNWPCATTLVYTGAGVPVRFYGAKASGSSLIGICLRMEKSAEAFIDIDRQADDTTLQDV